jgi:hypothetical protein
MGKMGIKPICTKVEYRQSRSPTERLELNQDKTILTPGGTHYKFLGFFENWKMKGRLSQIRNTPRGKNSAVSFIFFAEARTDSHPNFGDLLKVLIE